MKAYLSSLPQPMTPERSALYARVLGETSSWSDVALVEAREIISRNEAPEPQVEWFVGGGKTLRVDVTAHRSHAQMQAGNTALILAESLAHFLTLDLQ